MNIVIPPSLFCTLVIVAPTVDHFIGLSISISNISKFIILTPWICCGLIWYCMYRATYCNVYINQRDAEILVNSPYFFIKLLCMFRTIISLKHTEPFNEKIKTIHKNLCILLVYIHIVVVSHFCMWLNNFIIKGWQIIWSVRICFVLLGISFYNLPNDCIIKGWLCADKHCQQFELCNLELDLSDYPCIIL